MNEIKVKVGTGGAVPIIVDDELSLTSENPVQNKVITAALGSKANSADLAAVASSGSYNDLTDKPAIPAPVTVDAALSAISENPVQNKVITAALGGKANSADLAAVASSGSYNDLTDKPAIPAPVTVDAALSDISENPVQNKVITAALASISEWITSVPEMHRNIYRGKYLGNSVSAAQLAAIADGSFDDLYVGDYWEIPVTIDGTTKNVKWRIADIDYFIGYRDAVETTKRMTAHHLVIVPDTALYTSQPGGRSNGYNGSDIRTSGLDKAKTAINTAFPDMVLTHKNYISTAIDSNGTVTRCEEQTCTIELMSEVMVFGFNRFQQPANQQGYVYYSLGGQFALFGLSPKWRSHNAEEPIIPISGVVSYLLQDPCYSTNQQFWTGAWTIEIGPLNYTNNSGVRPYFIIGTR